MSLTLTYECTATAGALGGVWLGYVAATRTARRRVWFAGLWAWMVIGLTAPAGRGLALAGGLPLMALCAARGFDAGREQRNAARSLGASEWRIFWRVMLPIGWRGVGGGALLVMLRMVLDRAIAAYL
jgi:molybdate transport system permease protein